MLEFRKLRADEIDARVATCSAKGVQLLLYKDARCDMNILDETVGPMNWQRSHVRENANCIVSIWDEDKKQWVSKEDTGTESQTEQEKGLASDSFKRACFNWGIGRELYTSPFIWFPADKVKMAEKNGKPTCYDRFTVVDLKYSGNCISSVTLKNDTTKAELTFGDKTAKDEQKKPKTAEIKSQEVPVTPIGEADSTKVTRDHMKQYAEAIKAKHPTADNTELNDLYLRGVFSMGVGRFTDLTVAQFNVLMGKVE